MQWLIMHWSIIIPTIPRSMAINRRHPYDMAHLGSSTCPSCSPGYFPSHGGPPQWSVYKGKSHWNGWSLEVTLFMEPPTCQGTDSKLCWKFDPNVRFLRPSGSFTCSKGLLKQYPKVKSSRPQFGCFCNWSWVFEKGVYHRNGSFLKLGYPSSHPFIDGFSMK